MGEPGFLDEYLPYLLQKADHLLSADFHASLQKAGVQISEWRVLAVLADHQSLSVQEVANIALLPQPTTSHACRRLEDDGLLSRVESEADRRRKMLALTEDGRELVDGLIAKARSFEAATLAALALDRTVLLASLRETIQALETN